MCKSESSDGTKGDLPYLTKSNDGWPKLAKGTYLIKITPHSKDGSGKFSLTIKWRCFEKNG